MAYSPTIFLWLMGSFDFLEEKEQAERGEIHHHNGRTRRN
jgi:hypothetical protein